MDTNQPIEQLSKKERRDIRRQEKANSQKEYEKGKIFRIVRNWTIGIVLVGGMTYGLFLASNKKPTPLLGESFPIQGQEHIVVGASHLTYNSNPPTSGPHYAEPAKWGVYQTELPDEQLVHNLEHGGIWISYKGVDETSKTALEKLAQTHAKIIVEPREKDDAPIILASWGQIVRLQKYDEQEISNFIKTNSNRSPEPFAQ